MRLGVHLLAWWRLSRPETWMVSVLPFYVGYVLASKDLVPAPQALADGWGAVARGEADGALAAAQAWLGEAWPVLVGATVLGPMLWTATLLVNACTTSPATG